MRGYVGGLMVVLAVAFTTDIARGDSVHAKFTHVANAKAVHLQNGGTSLYVWAGEYSFDRLALNPDAPTNPAFFLGDQFGGYCIELSQPIYYNQEAWFEVAPLADAPVDSPMGTDRAELLRRLWGSYATGPSAEFQVAVWEILAETTSSYNVAKDQGTFYASGTGEVDKDLINSWLSDITADNYTGPTANLVWALTNKDVQDYAVLIESGGGPPVPEPVTMAGLLMGVGGLVHYVRRKRGGQKQRK